MEGRWTEAQVLSLAPDPASRQAGGSLADPSLWTSSGACAGLVWGLCAGSGAKPYQTMADLSDAAGSSGPAYRCSCPSRKVPCKHALALLLNWSAGRVADVDEPADFAASWKAGRDARAATAREPKGERDERAAARRAEQRESRVSAGLAELEIWLRDQVRTGLSAAAANGYRHAERVAARMVDAQAPGVAAALRRSGAIPATGEGWPARLLAEYAQLHLLALAHDRLGSLPPDLAAVVRSRVGYTVTRDEVLATPAVTDEWRVLARRELLDATVPARRIWLHGGSTGRFALLLIFDARGTFAGHPDANLRPGTVLDADLHYYPGRPALRALVGNRRGEPVAGPAPPCAGAIGALLAAWADALAADPWLTEWPALLRGTPVTAGERWHLADSTGRAVPLLPGGVDLWPLIAVAGGGPVTVAGEYRPEGLRPLTCWHGNLAVSL